jgi:prepilin-type N-terminal cleavage/methylation domain-containing protein
LRERGFSLVELAVVVIAVGVLAGFALDRLLPLVGRAEHIAFLQVRNELRSALMLEAAARIAAGERRALAALAGANPMELLLDPPGNYLGTLEPAVAADVPGRHWYYDAAAGHLVYRVGRHARFDGLGGPPDRIELAVRLVYEDRDGDAAFDPEGDAFAGIRLESRHAFAWRD